MLYMQCLGVTCLCAWLRDSLRGSQDSMDLFYYYYQNQVNLSFCMAFEGKGLWMFMVCS